jgi:fatty acid amide hydrolase
MLSSYLGALSADDGATMFAALKGGAVDPVLETMRRFGTLPVGARRLLGRSAGAVGQSNMGLMLGAMGEKSAAELWRLTDELRSYRLELLDSMDREGIDALLCPPAATPAWPHGESKNFTLASSYSIVFNATQLPAGVVPVTRVRADEAGRQTGRDSVERRAARVDEKSAGLPVGVQVAGRPWQDHVVLAVMAAIEAGVSRDDGFPTTPVALGAA